MEEPLEGSMYHILEKRNLRPADQTSCTLEVVSAVEQTSELLGCPIGEPLFYLVAHLIRSDGTPASLSHNYIRASRYMFRIP